MSVDPGPTIESAIESYLDLLETTKRPSTVRSYRGALKAFDECLKSHELATASTPLSMVSEEWIIWFMEDIRLRARSTQRVYATALVGWYGYLAKEESLTLDMEAVRSFSSAWQERSPPSTPLRPTEENVIKVVEHVAALSPRPGDSQREQLRTLRDKAIILSLADAEFDLDRLITLKRSDASWSGPICSIQADAGLGERTALSRRASDALRDYLNARTPHDDAQGVPLTKLSLLARHDRGSGAKILPLSTTSIRSIVKLYSTQTLGKAAGEAVTPRALRQYSVISKLLAAFPSLHPKVIAHCNRSFELGHYDDAIFNAFRLVEEEVREKAGLTPNDYGADLITKAMNPNKPMLHLSDIASEQESGYLLFRGSLGLLKNPRSHRHLGTSDPMRAFEIITIASHLLRILDEASLGSR